MGIRKSPAPGSHGFDQLLHPANAFAGPMAVVDDQDLTLTEKRALLASWATDARATGAAPILLDDVLGALNELDRRSGNLKPPPRYRRILERRVPGVFGRRGTAGRPGPALN